ncbi:MAG: aminoacetone oxidase family FAD-binding enzyme [Eubacterium sp.]|nr:aminoacetone oxidase family FAD-binding enzyme [Eubacterium sp.]
MEYHEIIIVGAGASGLMCGYLLGRQGRDVCLLDKNDTAGKKLAATGNGRCNYTNRNMSPVCYYGDRNYVEQILKRFGPEEAITLFGELGILTREKDGYCYPYNGQAATVRELLVQACRESGVVFAYGTKAAKIIHKKEGMYELRCGSGVIYQCRSLILATGGRANGPLGGDGSGYKLCRSMGHHVTQVVPGLTGLKAEGSEWKQLAGIRMQGKFSLYADHMLLGEEAGEIQIVKDGISGIPVFQLCRLAAKAMEEGKKVTGKIDFVPQMTESQMEEWLIQHGSRGLSGIVNKKWIPVLTKREKNLNRLSAVMKKYEVSVSDTFGLEKAQVSAGGVATEEICVDTMESLLHRDLYLLGELQDIDGICGGYNLHFAWATAAICSQHLMNNEDKNVKI